MQPYYGYRLASPSTSTASYPDASLTEVKTLMYLTVGKSIHAIHAFRDPTPHKSVKMFCFVDALEALDKVLGLKNPIAIPRNSSFVLDEIRAVTGET